MKVECRLVNHASVVVILYIAHGFVLFVSH